MRIFKKLSLNKLLNIKKKIFYLVDLLRFYHYWTFLRKYNNNIVFVILLNFANSVFKLLKKILLINWKITLILISNHLYLNNNLIITCINQN